MMNKTWRSFFSVLLAIALLLPMVPVARAADEVKVDCVGSDTIYYREKDQYHEAYAGEVTVTAEVTAAALNDPSSAIITWELEREENCSLSFVSPLGEGNTSKLDENGKAEVTLRAASLDSNKTQGTAIVHATVTGGGLDEKTLIQGYKTVLVRRDRVDPSAVGFADKSLSVQVNQTAEVKFKNTPRYPSGNGSPTVEYFITSPDPAGAVEIIDKATGKIKGMIADGRAVIQARIDGELVNDSVVVSVKTPSSNFTGSTAIGSRLSMQEFYDDIRSAFRDVYNAYPDNIMISNINKANATLMSKNNDEIENDTYSLAEFREMYLRPTREGTFTCTIDAADSKGVNRLRVTMTIDISVPSVTIRIPIDGSTNYSFARASADSTGKTGVQLVKESINTIGAFNSITFGAVSTESSNVGSLYTSSVVNASNRVSRGTTVSFDAITELYFVPSRAGTYRVPFTAYSVSGSTVCTGELFLPVDGSSLNLTLNLGSVAPYTFSEKPSGDVASLYTQFLNVINSSIGSGSWGVRFSGASAASVGVLHQTSSHTRAISENDYIANSAISKLYYVPARSGTYEINYSIYSDENSTTVIASGKLTIRTSTIPAGAPDIAYTILTKGTVSLSENDFIDFFRAENGDKYQLAYVVFNESDGEGVFYHGKDSFQPYNSADFYTSTYTGTTPSSARYLDRLSFTAPNAAGYTAVLFTCYGGTTTDSTAKATTGKLCIFYTEDGVPTVSYDAFGVTSVSLKASDFAAVYNTVRKTTINKPEFSIQLLSTPGKGTLYHYYSNNSSRVLSSSNIASYTFWVNSTSGNSVEEISYSGGRNSSGTDEVLYLVSTPDGTVLYIGTIEFKLSANLALNVTNDGSNFQLSDFYNQSDSDPVLYVTFPKPSAGKVYVYANGRYVTAASDTKLYTISSADGQYPLTSAFYAPRANETGTVTIKCVSHHRSGVTSNSTITLNVLSKVSSGSFGDVGGVFSWAANSIDFASKLGLVNGTQLNPPIFSPANTMRRSDFVLMLYRLAGSPAVSGAQVYTDVTSDKYYYDSAVWAYRNNIMRNVTVNGLYNPEGALTRQDFAQILFNYTSAMGGNTANSGSIRSYADASSVSSNTLEGVTWAVANGYITSAVAGQLYIEPTRAATRAEISTLLHRYLTY